MGQRAIRLRSWRARGGVLTIRSPTILYRVKLLSERFAVTARGLEFAHAALSPDDDKDGLGRQSRRDGEMDQKAGRIPGKDWEGAGQCASQYDWAGDWSVARMQISQTR